MAHDIPQPAGPAPVVVPVSAVEQPLAFCSTLRSLSRVWQERADKLALDLDDDFARGAVIALREVAGEVAAVADRAEHRNRP